MTIQFPCYLNFGCITFALLTFMRLILKIIIEMDLLPQNKLEAFVSHKCSFFYSSFRLIMENVAKLKNTSPKIFSAMAVAMSNEHLWDTLCSCLFQLTHNNRSKSLPHHHCHHYLRSIPSFAERYFFPWPSVNPV